MTDANGYPINPTQRNGESGTAFRSRSRTDFGFDPGTTGNPTSNAAWKATFRNTPGSTYGSKGKPSGDATDSSAMVPNSPLRRDQPGAQPLSYAPGSFMQAIASLPSIMPSPLLTGVNDMGLPPAKTAPVSSLSQFAAGGQKKRSPLISRIGGSGAFQSNYSGGTVAQNSGLAY